MSDIENLPEKEKLNIYENDEAYMLYDEKEQEEQDGDQLLEDDMELNLNSDNDNAIYDFEVDHGNLEEQIDAEENGTRRKTEIEIENLNDGEDLNEEIAENFDRSKMQQEIENESKSYSNLITLKYISVCQSCKENFNSRRNLPYLLKCGHFFCRICLEQKFSEEDGRVFCPDDGIIANSIGDLKILNNLIIEKTIDEDEPESTRKSEFCKIHNTQKLSHYIEDTDEVICVYCAFSKFKKNPKYEIKEIKDKCEDLTKEIDKHLEDNQQYVETLRLTLNDIQTNKQNEIERVSNFFDDIYKFLEEKKQQTLEKIENLFTANTENFSKQLNYFSTRMEDAEIIKANFIEVVDDNSSKISQALEKYHQYVREANDTSKFNMELFEYKFSHDDESKLYKYLSNFGDLKTVKKNVRFTPKSTINYLQQKLANINTISSAANVTNDNNLYDYQFKKIEKSNFNSAKAGNIVNTGNMSNINSNAAVKNYESNLNSNNFPTPHKNYNQYSNAFHNDILNTSDLLNENEFVERGAPVIKANKSNYSYISKTELNGQNDSNLMQINSNPRINTKYLYNNNRTAQLNSQLNDSYKVKARNSLDEQRIHMRSSTFKFVKSIHEEIPLENNLNRSHVTIEGFDKKITFNIIDEEVFFDKKKIEANLLNVKNSICFTNNFKMEENKNSQQSEELEKSIENIKIEKLNLTNFSQSKNFKNSFDTRQNFLKENREENSKENFSSNCDLNSQKQNDSSEDIIKIENKINIHHRQINGNFLTKTNQKEETLNDNHALIEVTQQCKRLKIDKERDDEIKNHPNEIEKKPLKQLENKEQSIKKITDKDIVSDSESSLTPHELLDAMICLICDHYYSIEKILSTPKCKHTFCRKCTKDFFEEKIEQGDFQLKCPIFKCLSYYEIELILNLISKDHRISLTRSTCKLLDMEQDHDDSKGFDKISSKLSKAFTLTKSVKKSDSLNNTNLLRIDSIKCYSKRHVLDVNNNESFFLYSKAKDHICSKCNEPALYGKTSKISIKCLNCFNILCKFCLRSYSFEHFEMSSNDYCRVYFRKRLKKNTTSIQGKSITAKIFYLLLLVIVSFLFLLFACYAKSSLWLEKFLRIKKKGRDENFLLRTGKKILYFISLPIIYGVITLFFIINVYLSPQFFILCQ